MPTNSVLVVQIPDLPLADSIANGDILILTQNHHRVDQIYTPGKDVAKKLSVSSLLNYITSQNNLSFNNGISAYNFTSIAPQGAIPFNVTSDTLCPNLNVQYLNSKSSDYFINVVTNQSVDGNKTFTGTISGPTPEKDTNTDQFSTTKFVLSQASDVTPLIPSLNGTIGTSFKYAREDHKHPYNFTSLDTDIKMNGVQSKGILTTYAPADHIHPIDTSRSPVSDPTFTTKATAPYFVSTATLGTQPLQVTSSTMVTNLNANYLGGSQLSDLAPKAGSADIVTVGTIGTGVWNASVISPLKGGTGVGNGSNNTITFTGNYSLGLTLSAATSLTLPISGTLATVAGTIAKTSATGSSVIPSGTIAQRDASPQLGYFRYNTEAGFEGYTSSGWTSMGGVIDGNKGDITISGSGSVYTLNNNAITTALNTQLTAVAKLSKDQTTGNFTDQVRYNSSLKRLEYWDGDSWEPLNLTGVAAGTAATLQTSRAIGGVSFNGSADINLPGVNAAGNQNTSGSATTAVNSSATGTIPTTRYENGLRIVRGEFTTSSTNNGVDAPTVTAGSGFTVTRQGTGLFFVTCTNGFSTKPTGVVSSSGPHLAYVSSVNTTNLVVQLNYPIGSASDAPSLKIQFILIGRN